MDSSPLISPERVRLNRNGARLFLGIGVYTAVQALVLFLGAGTLRWPAAGMTPDCSTIPGLG